MFDEPTIGLHPLDVRVLLGVFQRLIGAGATVIVIEHDLDMIANADYVVDLGPGGGKAGGRIVAAGTPEQVAQNPASITRRLSEGMSGAANCPLKNCLADAQAVFCVKWVHLPGGAGRPDSRLVQPHLKIGGIPAVGLIDQAHLMAQPDQNLGQGSGLIQTGLTSEPASAVQPLLLGPQPVGVQLGEGSFVHLEHKLDAVALYHIGKAAVGVIPLIGGGVRVEDGVELLQPPGIGGDTGNGPELFLRVGAGVLLQVAVGPGDRSSGIPSVPGWPRPEPLPAGS